MKRYILVHSYNHDMRLIRHRLRIVRALLKLALSTVISGRAWNVSESVSSAEPSQTIHVTIDLKLP